MSVPAAPPPTPGVGLPEVRHRPRWLERHWRPAIIVALLILAVAGGYAIHATERRSLDAIHGSQLQACERGNVLRRRLQVNVRVLDALLAEAARVRRVQAAQTDDPKVAAASQRAATVYEHLQDLTRPVATVDCEAVIPRP